MTIDTLRSSFSGRILIDGDEGFSQFVYPAAAPTLILRPETTDDVVAAIGYARDNGLSLSVRSSGHSGGTWTTVPGGLVIDMTAFATISVTGIRATIGSGATWGAVADALGTHGLALSSGDTRSVGVGGLTLGGGVGWLVREVGLALDSLVSARIVTASGELVTASGGENPDLFWAIRGGGGNFGVVLDFIFEAHPLAGIVHGAISYSTDNIAPLLRGFRDTLRDSPTLLNATFSMFPEMGPVPASGPQIHVVWAGRDLDAALDAVAPLLELDGFIGHDLAVKAYADALVELPAPPAGAPMPTLVGSNGWVPDLDDDTIDAISGLAAGDGKILTVRYLGGRFNQVDVEATAFAYRDSEALVMTLAFLPPAAPAELIAATEAAWLPMVDYVEGIYGNFEEGAGEAIVAQMYPESTLARLAAVKHYWDPQNLFSQNQNILPVAD